MRVLISQFRCQNCKKPLKSLLVEECPKCGKRLTANQLIKNIKLLILAIPVAILIATIYALTIKSEQFSKNPFIFAISIITVTIIMMAIIGSIAIKGWKRLQKDKEFIGTGMTTNFERHLSYVEVDIDKSKLIFPPLFVLVLLGFLIFLLIIDAFFYDFIPYENLFSVIMLAAVLVILFAVTAFYSLYKYHKKTKKAIQEAFS